jgi:hypothetical protein
MVCHCREEVAFRRTTAVSKYRAAGSQKGNVYPGKKHFESGTDLVVASQNFHSRHTYKNLDFPQSAT